MAHKIQNQNQNQTDNQNQKCKQKSGSSVFGIRKSRKKSRNNGLSSQTSSPESQREPPLRRLNLLSRQLLRGLNPTTSRQPETCGGVVELCTTTMQSALGEQLILDQLNAESDSEVFSSSYQVQKEHQQPQHLELTQQPEHARSSSGSGRGCFSSRGRSNAPANSSCPSTAFEQASTSGENKLSQLIALLDERETSSSFTSSIKYQEREFPLTGTSDNQLVGRWLMGNQNQFPNNNQSSQEELVSDEQHSLLYLEESWRNFVRLETSGNGSENKQQGSKSSSLSLQQEAIWELLSTELFYLNCLKVIICLFQETLLDLQRHSLLTEINPERIFSNIGQVYEANWIMWSRELQPMLAKARSSCSPLDPSMMRNAFVQIRSTFNPYYRYCLDYSACLQYVKEVNRSNELFKVYLAWCESQKDCERLRLSDLLAKPMQRLTRYSLLLRAIAKHSDSPQQNRSLEQTINHMNRFVLTVDLELRRRDELERLSETLSRLEGNVELPVGIVEPTSSTNDELECHLKQYCYIHLKSPLFNCQFACQRQLLFDSRTHLSQLTFGQLRFKDAQVANNSKVMNVVLLLFTDQLLVCQLIPSSSSQANGGGTNRWLPGQRAKSSSHTLLATTPNSVISNPLANNGTIQSKLLELPPSDHLAHPQPSSSGASVNRELVCGLLKLPAAWSSSSTRLAESYRLRTGSQALSSRHAAAAANQDARELPEALRAPRALSLILGPSVLGSAGTIPNQSCANSNLGGGQQRRCASQQPSCHNSNSSLFAARDSFVKLASADDTTPTGNQSLARHPTLARSFDGGVAAASSRKEFQADAPMRATPKAADEELNSNRLRCIRAPYPIERLAVHELRDGLGLLCCQLNDSHTIASSFVIIVSGGIAGAGTSPSETGDRSLDSATRGSSIRRKQPPECSAESRSDSESLQINSSYTSTTRRQSNSSNNQLKAFPARSSPASQLKALILSAQAKLKLAARFHQSYLSDVCLDSELNETLNLHIERLLKAPLALPSSSEEQPRWARPHPPADPIGRALLEQYQQLLLNHNLLTQESLSVAATHRTINANQALSFPVQQQQQQQQSANYLRSLPGKDSARTGPQEAAAERQLLSPHRYRYPSGAGGAAAHRAHFSRSARARDLSADESTSAEFSIWPHAPTGVSPIAVHWTSEGASLSQQSNSTGTIDSADSLELLTTAGALTSVASSSTRNSNTPASHNRPASRLSPATAGLDSLTSAMSSTNSIRQPRSQRRHLSSLRRQNVIISASSDNQQQQQQFLSQFSTTNNQTSSSLAAPQSGSLSSVTGGGRHRLLANLRTSSSQATTVNTSAAFDESTDQQQQHLYWLDNCAAVRDNQDELLITTTQSDYYRSFELSPRSHTAHQRNLGIAFSSPLAAKNQARSASVETRTPISVTLTLPTNNEHQIGGDREVYLNVPTQTTADLQPVISIPAPTQHTLTSSSMSERLSPIRSVSVTSPIGEQTTCTSTSSSQAASLSSPVSHSSRASPVLSRLKRLFKRTDSNSWSSTQRVGNHSWYGRKFHFNRNPSSSSPLTSGCFAELGSSSNNREIRRSSSSLEIVTRDGKLTKCAIKFSTTDPLSEPLSCTTHTKKSSEDRLADISCIRSLIESTTGRNRSELELEPNDDLQNSNSNHPGYLGFHEKLQLHQKLHQNDRLDLVIVEEPKMKSKRKIPRWARSAAKQHKRPFVKSMNSLLRAASLKSRPSKSSD